MKKTAIIALSALLVLGCAAVRTATEVRSNPRIVYRDLTRPEPVAFPVPDDTDDSKAMPQKPEQTSSDGSRRPSFFIEFANDSWRSFDENSLQAFSEETPADALVLVVGHSHGSSAVGTLRLASRRAEAVADYLTGRGFDNVHVMAAWGGQKVAFAPSRGVHLYVLDAEEQDESVSIAFSKTVTRSIEENHDVRPEIPDTMAGYRPSENRLGGV